MIYTNRSVGDGKAIFCVQSNLDAKPRVLLDSEKDPYLAKYPIDNFCVSDDNRFLTYFVPQIRHRFEEIRIVDIKTGKPLPDIIQWTYLSDMVWHGDGFYYGRYPKPSDSESAEFATEPPKPEDHWNEKLYFHRIGTPPSSDALVYEDLSHPKQKYLYLEGFDHHWMHVHIFPRLASGTSTSEWFSLSGKSKLELTAIQPEIAPGRFFSCDDVVGGFLLYTKFRSPKGRVLLVDPEHPTEPSWKTIVAEGPEDLTDAEPAAGKLILCYKLSTGGNRVEIRNRQGKLETKLPLQKGEEADVQWCSPSETEFFFSTRLGTEPKKYFRYDVRSRKVFPFD